MEKFSFFNDIDDDRIYFAEDFARFFSLFFSNGIFNNGLLVSSNNDMTVSISVGDANINGYQYYNDSNKTLIIENADGMLDRIDNIVIRWDFTNREISAKVVQGEYSESPTAPELQRNSTIYDLRIAKVSVPAGTTTITQDLIEDTRFLENDCGNVISSIETPNTEELYSQLYAKANKLISESQKDFEEWFANIQNTLSGDVAGNLATQILQVKNEAKLKSYTTTLSKTSWTLNEITNQYEYTVTNANITASHKVTIDADIENKQKFTGIGQVKSFSGGFKITSTEVPEDDIEISITYQLAVNEVIENVG